MKNKVITILLILNLITTIGVLNFFLIGQISKEKEIIKQMPESEQVEGLQTQINNLNASHKQYLINVQNNKKQIAEAITYMGIETSEDASTDIMVNNIMNINNANLEQNIVVNKKGANVTKTETFTGYLTYLVCSFGATSRVNSYSVTNGDKINIYEGFDAGYSMYIDKINTTSKNEQVTITYSGGIEGCLIIGTK